MDNENFKIIYIYIFKINEIKILKPYKIFHKSLELNAKIVQNQNEIKFHKYNLLKYDKSIELYDCVFIFIFYFFAFNLNTCSKKILIKPGLINTQSIFLAYISQHKLVCIVIRLEM